MKPVARVWLFVFSLTLSVAAVEAATPIYRSVDEAGQVTFSSEPPKGAVEVESLDIGPGPSSVAEEEARARMKEAEQRTDARFDAMMERRRLEQQGRREAREEAERRRWEREAEDRRFRDDSSGGYVIERPNYRRYSPGWRRPHRPPRPVHPIHPPRYRPHPNVVPNRPHDSHINPPTRNW